MNATLFHCGNRDLRGMEGWRSLDDAFNEAKGCCFNEILHFEWNRNNIKKFLYTKCSTVFWWRCRLPVGENELLGLHSISRTFFYDANHKIASNLPSAQITDKSGFSFSICGKRHNHQFSFVKETKVKHKWNLLTLRNYPFRKPQRHRNDLKSTQERKVLVFRLADQRVHRGFLCTTPSETRVRVTHERSRCLILTWLRRDQSEAAKAPTLAVDKVGWVVSKKSRFMDSRDVKSVCSSSADNLPRVG